ncbi:PTS glucitol/sorbitol transporter subunit IIA [Enterococcus sp. UD-01]|uniref:PTS glucitol/sorbitol transporter subunit IIA n=1 Tax=Enterococcus sp. UD-01 TaxID=3373911 RepID=UPI00383400A9
MIESKVIEIGELVAAFAEEKLLVLFGPTATAELRSICVIHEFNKQPENLLKPGLKMEIGGQTYTITKVGDAANKNFDELGHISIYFRTGENEILPGAIIAEPEIYPAVKLNDTIRFHQ